jgi:O-Antigen ligase
MTARWALALNQRALWFLFWSAQALVLLTSSYDFYHVNSYKVALALTCALLLSPLIGFAVWHRQLATPPLRLVAFALLPLATTVPGWIMDHGRWNYLAGEQLSQWLVILLWAWIAYALTAGKNAEPLPAQAVVGKNHKQAAPANAGRNLEYIAAGLHYLAGASALVALIDVATKGFDLLTVGNGLRATGSYGNPNYLAAFLLLVLPVASLRVTLGVRAIKNAPRNPLLLDVAALALIIGALLLTQTRLAQMLTAGFLLLLAMLWIYSYQRARAIPLLLGLITLSAAGIVTAWQMKLPWLFRFERLLSGRDFSARLVPWQAALSAWREAPWFGHGPGSYYALFFQHVARVLAGAQFYPSAQCRARCRR